MHWTTLVVKVFGGEAMAEQDKTLVGVRGTAPTLSGNSAHSQNDVIRAGKR
jgi:hypothetical protein